MTPTQADTLLAFLRDLRDDIGRRFEDVKCEFQEVNSRLDIVDSRISKVEVADAISQALVVQAKVIADAKVAEAGAHILAYRWRVTIGIAAGGALFGAFLGVLNFVVGH